MFRKGFPKATISVAEARYKEKLAKEAAVLDAFRADADAEMLLILDEIKNSSMVELFNLVTPKGIINSSLRDMKKRISLFQKVEESIINGDIAPFMVDELVEDTGIFPSIFLEVAIYMAIKHGNEDLLIKLEKFETFQQNLPHNGPWRIRVEERIKFLKSL